jgi:hypothetical protein
MTNEVLQMALTDGDKAICAQLAGEIIEKVIAGHIKSCPHGIKLQVSRAYLVGIILGSSIVGGGVGATILKIFTM